MAQRRLNALLAAMLAAAACIAIAAGAREAAARIVVDSAGRRVEVPEVVARVMAAGPPASVALYTLAPDKLVGWIRAFSPEEREFLAPAYADLPAHGRLTGRGSTASLETVIALRPDVIVDVGSVDPTYASLADRVQEQTGIPYVLIDGTLLNTPATYRLLGSIIGAQPRAEELAAYAERILQDVREGLADLPPEQHPRVYYGRGPEGLETGLAGSINLEVLEAVGAVNVAAAAGDGGLTVVSMEQVLSWNPAVILTHDATFYRSVVRDPLWQGIDAIQARRVYRAPSLPWGWFDSPPGANRLIGLRWLAVLLYPDRFTDDLRAVTRDFYRTFYHVELSAQQADRLLRDATAAPGP